MAILLRAADQQAAAGLEIESQEVKDDHGHVKGQLPSKYFHTNLQHCSDVGRLAFLDAQHGMATIRSTARSLIADEGSIAYIIDLLEDPQDARHNLRPEIEAVKKTAMKCLESAKAITARFEYWHLVIIHLKQTSLSKQGDIVKEKEATDSMRSDAIKEETKQEADRELIQERIQLQNEQLAQAARGVERAQAEVDRLVQEPYALSREAIPMPSLLKKSRGIVKIFRIAIFGKTENEEKEDEDLHQKHIRELREGHLYRQNQAKARLEEARENKAKKMTESKLAHQQLSDRKHRLAEARANLSRTRDQLQLLGNKKLELDSILAILDKSTKALVRLKDQIEPLVDFFTGVLGDIDHNIDLNLEAFLRPIVNGITEGTTKDEVEAINLSRRSKDKMMATALQMQCRFSAIADISAAYVTVSSEYIRPAITRMESLSALPDSEWDVRSGEFIHWCDGIIMDIDGVAQETGENVEKNMALHVDIIHRRAIEASEENYALGR